MITFVTRNIIDVNDWDNLVSETYGKPYVFQQQDGCKERQQVRINVPCKHPYDFENESIPEQINGDEMGVSFAAWLKRDPNEWNGDEEDKHHIDLFWERNFYPCEDMLVNDLFAKGLIPEGEYYIDINW
jgi:hypothetical protein